MGVRFKNMIRIQAAILLVLAVSLLIPLAVALYYKESGSGLAFLFVSG